MSCECLLFFFFQAEDGIRDLVRSRGLGDVYKRQVHEQVVGVPRVDALDHPGVLGDLHGPENEEHAEPDEHDLSLIHI